jgi:hypothetical protein
MVAKCGEVKATGPPMIVMLLRGGKTVSKNIAKPRIWGNIKSFP